MDVFLWAGTALGAGLGVLHGVYLYRRHSARGKARSLYTAVWAFALWTLFGSYVLAFWILGFVGQSVARLAPRRRTA